MSVKESLPFTFKERTNNMSFDKDIDLGDLTVGIMVGEGIGQEDNEDRKEAEKESGGSFGVDPDEGFEVKETSGERKHKSLKTRHKKRREGTFEQWVEDVITGRKTLDDEL